MSEPTLPPPILELAPPKKRGDRFWAVIFSGLFSTAISLVIVFLISHFAEHNVMGWYLNYILPAGAILVGLLASSGYALSAWLAGVKIRGLLLVVIVLLQILAYFGAQYLEFQVNGPFADPNTGHVLNFAEYYHYSTILMSWQETGHKESSPLGGWGYLVRSGEIVGFVAGTLIVPVILMKAPYCELCERYMRRLQLAVIPASSVEINGDGATGPAAEEAVATAAAADMNAFVDLGTAGNTAGFEEKLAKIWPFRGQNARRARRIEMTLVYCKNCKQAHLRFVLAEGSGKQIKHSPLSQHSVSPAFVNELLASSVLKTKPKTA